MNLSLVCRTYFKFPFLIFILCIIPLVLCASNFEDDELYKFKQLDINNGLSNNQVNAFLQDSQGFMWFGTGRGLNRFDGLNFKVFRHDLNNAASIPFNSIDFLLEDFEQNIWIGEENEFALYNPKKDIFSELPLYYKKTTIPLNALQDLFLDHEANLWFIDANYGLFKYSSKYKNVDSVHFSSTCYDQKEFNYLKTMGEDSNHNIWVVSNLGEVQKLKQGTFQVIEHYQLQGISKDRNNNFNIFIDESDDVWVYVPGLPLGVFHIPSSTKKIFNFTDQSKPVQLNNNLVSDILQDKDGKIWIATDHGGLNILDKKINQMMYLTNDRDNKYSISQNSINSLYRDKNDIIWAGTYKKGINYYHKNLIRFKHISNLPQASNSLPYNDVNCFAEDNLGNLWIGTNGGGLIYFDRRRNTYKTFKHNPNDPNSISNNVIVALYYDHRGNLWIGTYYGGLNRYYKKKFYHYRHNPEDQSSISDDRVWEIMEDSQQNLWIGTLNGGLNLFDQDKYVFYRYMAGDINSVGSNFVMSIIEDSQHNLWMGTDYGIDKLDLSTKRFYHYDPEEGAVGKLSNKDAVDLMEDGRGYIWIATRQGLNVFDKKTSKFRVFTESDGLTDSNIKTIQEDQQGNVWVATNNGLSKIQILSTKKVPLEKLQIKIINYDLMDGLQGKEFNEKAAYRTRKGELIFGGSNGFNLFIPEKLVESVQHCKIVLTNLKVFNQEVKVGVPFRDRVILEKSIFEQDEIVLHHNENVFSFEVAGIDYFHPEKNIFQYRLDGFKDEWLQLNAGKDITFTNLNAGNYQLRIRVSSDGQEWIEKSNPLLIKILPSFWKSKWGILIYLGVIIGLLLVLRSLMLERQRLRFNAEHERFESERIQQVDAIKTRFFTNISHEFRTPLTLIISPLEKIITQIKDENQRNHLILIHRNARRLLSMVNQLLDFRKMEVQKIEVKNSWGNMVEFIKETSMSFSDLADNKKIKFSFKSGKKSFFTHFDKDKTDKIISNLLVNAFKFTNEKGNVWLEIKFPETKNTDGDEATVKWIIRDNGIGIPPEEQDLIFERFYQNPLPGTIVNQGSGIGLSMVSEYVNLMGGTIKVESILGKGSTFIINIPVHVFSEETVARNNAALEPNQRKPVFFEHPIQKSVQVKFDAKKKTILLVEDNEDLRFYLKDNLKGKYNILEADNGGTGWELAEKHMPQLVVSDVMIPVLSGIELCAMIKDAKATKHIPVILLTAKVEAEPELEGLESGADDYIFKPFDFRILESRIENMINSREQLRMSYQSMIGINPKNIEVSSQDEKFIKKALEVVEQNISESSFSVEDLSKSMGMSRVSLYKKMLALTNKTPIEFIRILRLKRAADLLKNSQLTVSEVAYRVGFNNPRYFSKYFVELYGELPSVHIVRYRQNQGDISEETKKRFNI